MARYVVAIVGAAIGFAIGGPQGAMIGFSLGMTVGTILFPPPGPKVEGPRLTDLQVQVSSYGAIIPWVWGNVRAAGNVIWATDIIEKKKKEKQSSGGKGGGGATVTTWEYFMNIAIIFCKGRAEIVQVWADSKIIYSVYDGAQQEDATREGLLLFLQSRLTKDETLDPTGKYGEFVTIAQGEAEETISALMEQFLGVGNAPAYNNLCRLDLGPNMPLADFGNRIPNVTAELLGKPNVIPYGIRYFDAGRVATAVNNMLNYNDPLRAENQNPPYYFDFSNMIFNRSAGWGRAKKVMLYVGWEGTYTAVDQGNLGTYWTGPVHAQGNVQSSGQQWSAGSFTNTKILDEVYAYNLNIYNAYSNKVFTYAFQPKNRRVNPGFPSGGIFGLDQYMVYQGSASVSTEADPFRPGYVWHSHFSYYSDSTLYCTREKVSSDVQAALYANNSNDTFTPHSIEISPHTRNDNVIDYVLGFTQKYVWVIRYGGIIGWDQVVLFRPDSIDYLPCRYNGGIRQGAEFGGHYDWNASYCFDEFGILWQEMTCAPDDGTNYPVNANFRLWRYQAPKNINMSFGIYTVSGGGGGTSATEGGLIADFDPAVVTDVTPWGLTLGPESIPAVVQATANGWDLTAGAFGGDGGYAYKGMAMHGTNHLLLTAMVGYNYDPAKSTTTVLNRMKSAYFTYVNITNSTVPVVASQLNGPGGMGYFGLWKADFTLADNVADAVWFWDGANNWIEVVDEDIEKSSKVWPEAKGPNYRRWFKLRLRKCTGDTPGGLTASDYTSVLFRAEFVVGQAPVIKEIHHDATFYPKMLGSGNWQTTNTQPLDAELADANNTPLYSDTQRDLFFTITAERTGLGGSSTLETDLYKPLDPLMANRWESFNSPTNPAVIRISIGDDFDGELMLGHVVRDICNACGLTEELDYNVDGLMATPITGYIASRGMTGRQMLEPLQIAYAFDGVEIDGVLVWTLRGNSGIVTISERDLASVSGDSSEGKPKLLENRQQEIELPAKVVVRYADRNQDFQVGTQQSARSNNAQNSDQIMNVELGMSLTPLEGKQIAERSLYTAWVERNSYEFTLPPHYIRYDAGDVVNLTYKDVVFTLRLSEINFGGDGLVECKAVGADEFIYVPTFSVPPTPPTPPVPIQQTSSPMVTSFIDGPLLREADDLLPGFYSASEGSDPTKPWPGGAIYQSSNDTDFFVVAQASEAAVMGTALTLLPTAISETLDRTNVLRVNVGTDQTLTSCTFADLMNGSNIAMLGDELIAFQTATPVAGQLGQYDLTVLRRGIQGTEWGASGHAISERFIVISGALGLAGIQIATSEIGISRFYRPVTFGGSVADVVSVSFTGKANHLRPISPAHIMGTRAANDLTIVWTRRARKDNDWRDSVETPLDEPSENYEIDIMDGATVKRTLTSTTPSVVYSAANQTTDFGSPQVSVTVKVYQMSSRVGRGYPGQATV